MYVSSPKAAAWLSRAWPDATMGAFNRRALAARIRAKAAASKAAVKVEAGAPRVWLPGRLRPLYRAG